MFATLKRRARRMLHGRAVAAWYHPAYRLPLGGLEAARGVEPRRADHVRFWLLESGVLDEAQVRTPPAVAWEDVARVHEDAYLVSLADPSILARIFAVDAAEVVVDELLAGARLAVGGTVQAAFATLSTRAPAVNLLGGFHHAAPGRGAGFCVFNDIAVAVAVMRASGFSGRVAVIDLDAHPSDGTAECLRNDPACWQGSISGVSWGPLHGVDEVVLPPYAGDHAYLAALRGMLSRMPGPDLAFVIAGGDVMAGDRLGQVGLTADGVRQRDAMTARALRGVPQVWLPGGGYHPRAWAVLAETVELLATGHVDGVPWDYQPLRARFSSVAREMSPRELGGDDDLRAEDLDAMMGVAPRRPRLLGFYSREGVEYALFRHGILSQLHRLGYADIRIEVASAGTGDSLRVFGRAAGAEWLLVDVNVEQRRVADRPVLFVNWMELMHPRATFSEKRPALPGQRFPGLGLVREAAELLLLVARRLGLEGVVFRPAHFHVAYASRHQFRFVDAARQARFLQLLQDTVDVGVVAVSRALAEGRVRLDGAPYTWEPDEMVMWLEDGASSRLDVGASTGSARFTVV